LKEKKAFSPFKILYSISGYSGISTLDLFALLVLLIFVFLVEIPYKLTRGYTGPFVYIDYRKFSFIAHWYVFLD